MVFQLKNLLLQFCVFRPILDSLFWIKDTEWLSVKNVLLNTIVDCFCFRNILNQLKVQRWNTYCHKTEWIVTKYARAGEDPRCPQCKRIRTTRLTLDGLRLKRQKAFVDKNEEERLIRLFTILLFVDAV